MRDESIYKQREAAFITVACPAVLSAPEISHTSRRKNGLSEYRTVFQGLPTELDGRVRGPQREGKAGGTAAFPWDDLP